MPDSDRPQRLTPATDAGFWRSWCASCRLHLVTCQPGYRRPAELCCPGCQSWWPVLARGTAVLEGDVVIDGAWRVR